MLLSASQAPPSVAPSYIRLLFTPVKQRALTFSRYRGRLEMNKGITFGHENIGIVEEVGEDITTLKKGDRVVVDCFFDEATDNTDVETVSGLGLGAYPGFPQRNGGQANYLLVPFANVNLLPVPVGEEHELDYLLLADIWPTAWWALECAGQVIGDTVVVFGAG